jgi:hypothetical protein
MRLHVAALLIVSCLPAEALAQAVSDNMTCGQAIASYESNGRIYTYANGRTAVPIYRGVPASQRHALRCASKRGVMVTTSDNNRCVVGYYCAPTSGR